MRILVPYRPGHKDSHEELWQRNSGIWYNRCGDVPFHRSPALTQNVVERCVTAIRKNSSSEHDIVLILDSDVHPNEEWVSKLEIEVFQPRSTIKERTPRVMLGIYECLQEIPDGELVCYAYIADIVCGKKWDLHIDNAMKEHGDNCVYVPMWVEPRNEKAYHAQYCGEGMRGATKFYGEVTAKKIWNDWRKLCCHSLTMVAPIDREYSLESDLTEWSEICNFANMKNIVEPCGVRDYGYYACIVGKSDLFKKHSKKLLLTEEAPDLAFEAELGTKVVVTKSHVFHLHYDCVLEGK